MGSFASRGLRGGSRSLALVAGLAACTFALHTAQAADVPTSWLVAASDNWSVTSAWSAGTIPDNGVDDFLVTIGAAGSAYVVTLDIAPTIKDLTQNSLDARLELQTNLLTIDRDFSITNSRVQSTARAGQLDVSGTARLNNAHFHITRMVSHGTTIFEGAGNNDICDTEIDHEGAIMTWNDNGTITLDDGVIGARLINGVSSTFTITGDGSMNYAIGAQSTFENRGITRKNGGTGVTFINGPILDNTGTVEVQTGTFRVSNCAQYDIGTQKLTGGKWSVSNNATLDFLTQTITKNGGEISLDGVNSTFTQISGLNENSVGGKFSLTGGRIFTTTGSFTNNGTITVGTGSQLITASGGTFTRGVGSTLDLAGKLQHDGAAVVNLIDSKITLRTGGQYVDQLSNNALAGFNRIGAGGTFETVGVNYTFSSGPTALTIASGGRLSIGRAGVGNASTITVSGLTDYQAGSILDVVNGSIIISGGLIQRGALRGGGTVQADVISEGEIAPGASPGTLTIDGNLRVTNDCIYRCELAGNGLTGDFDVLNVMGVVDFFGGGSGPSAGTFELSLLPGFTASIGQQFDVMRFGDRQGQGFLNVIGLNRPNYGFISEFTELNTFRLTVVRIPAPGAAALLGISGLLAARRRR